MTAYDALAFLPLSCAALWDARQRIIPNWTVLLIALCAIPKTVLCLTGWRDALLGGLLTGGLLLAAALKWNGIGGGDVKLCAALGFLLGLSGAGQLLFLALLLLSVFGLLRRAESLPFAPFLWGAFILSFLI